MVVFCNRLPSLQDAAALERAASQLASLRGQACQQWTQGITDQKAAVDSFVNESLQQDQPTGGLIITGIVLRNDLVVDMYRTEACQFYIYEQELNFLCNIPVHRYLQALQYKFRYGRV